MSRLRHVSHALASGYAAMAASTLYGLCSIPLALHYLSREEFGLWALVTQVAGYFLLIDLGMSGSLSRFLMDHKDHKADGQYGSLIKTGGLVLLVQGACIGLGGMGLSFILPPIMDVPAHLASTFQRLVAGQCLLLGAGFIGRIFSNLLQTHQRFDVLNYSQIAQLGLSFAAQWAAFHHGWGVYSLLVGTFFSLLCGTALNCAAVLRLKLFAPKEARGQASWDIFKRVFAFGTELLLISVGLQLLNASQVVIISRTQGLAAAAVWAIATKTFVLAFQFVQRIFDYSASALGEMIVRGERSTLQRRYRDVLLFTASVAVFASVSLAICNGSFLALWTKGRISWPSYNDGLMAVLMLLNLVTRCQIGLAILAKQVKTMRWVYFLEGATFVAGAFFLAPRLGIPGIILMAIVANLLWSGGYGFRWLSRYLGVSLREMLFGWLRPAETYLAILVPLAAVLWLATSNLPPLERFIVNAALMTMGGMAGLWFFGLTPDLRREFSGTLQRLLPRRPAS